MSSVTANYFLAPGCREFGYKAFAECCSLQWVYASEGVANMFNSEAKFGQYLFQGCINLAEFTLSELPSPRGSAPQARTGEALRESPHLLSQSIS